MTPPPARREGGRRPPQADPVAPAPHPALPFVVGIMALGLLVRGFYLDIPVRHDEAVTALGYAALPFLETLRTYSNPNNHVLHTLLVQQALLHFGPAPWALRLPALLSGVALIGLTYVVAARRYGRTTGLLAALLVAVSTPLVEYSVVARGYSIVGAATLAAVAAGDRLLSAPDRRWLYWLGWAMAGAIGLYTVPTMVLPWAGLTLWLTLNLVLPDLVLPAAAARWRPDWKALGPVVLWSAATVGITAALYAPIWLENGVGVLLANRFVKSLSGPELLARVLALPGGLVRHWVGGSLAAAGVMAAGAAGFLWLRPMNGRFGLRLAIPLGVLALVAATRTVGDVRVWLFLVPLLLIAVAAGLTALVERFVALPGRRWMALGVAILLFAFPHVTTNAVRDTLEPGHVPGLSTIAERLSREVPPDGVIVADWITAWPLNFHLRLKQVPLAQRLPLHWYVGGAGESVDLRQVTVRASHAWLVFSTRDDGWEGRVAQVISRVPLPLGRPTLHARHGTTFVFSAPFVPQSAEHWEPAPWIEMLRSLRADALRTR